MQKGLLKVLALCTLLFAFSNPSFGIAISTNVVWNSTTLLLPAGTPYVVNEDVFIYPGGSLTINGGLVVKMNGGGHIIRVYSNIYTSGPDASLNGGRLVINGATVTTDDNWYGINVVGIETLSQQSPKMARATVSNSTIERADYGITNWDTRTDFNNFNHTGGGIVQVGNTTFHNNGFSYWLTHYRNFSISSPSTLLNDMSNLANCTFVRDLTNPTTFPPAAFVRLHEVEGVRIAGCNFTDNIGGGVRGIMLESAGVLIDRNCSAVDIYGNCVGGITPSTFNNLAFALYSYSPMNAHKVTMQNSTINNCRNGGIFLQGYQGPVFLRNTINLPPNSYATSAIAFEGCTGYRVEENTINTVGPISNSNIFGITVNNSGGSANEIYKNTINDANYAMQSNGDNSGGIFTTGLRFVCNNMTNTITDAYDISIIGGTATATKGIATAQNGTAGSSIASVGNNFSTFSSSYTDHNIYNVSNSIYYFYDAAALLSNPAQVSSNVIKTTAVANSCPSKIYSGGAASSLKAEYLQVKAFLETQIPNASADQVGELLNNYDLTVNNLLNLTDDEGNDNTPDQLIEILQSAQYNYEFQVRKAFIMAQINHFDEAIQTLSNLNTSFQLTPDAEDQIHEIIEMIHIGAMHAANNENWEMMSAGDRQHVHEIADHSQSWASFMARYYLATYEGYTYMPTMTLINDGKDIKDLFKTKASFSAATDLNIYPNPVKSMLTINGLQNETAAVTLFDVTGRVVLKTNCPAGNNTLDVSKLHSGNYIMVVKQTSGKSTHVKFTKD